MRNRGGSGVKRGVLAAAAIAGTLCLSAAARLQTGDRYAPREWESITVTRFARSVAVGPRFVGLGTEGGLLFYDRMADRWLPPMTRADGLPANSVRQVILGEDGRFFVQVRREVGVVDPLAVRYTPEPFSMPGPAGPEAPLPGNLFTGPQYLYLADGRISGPSGITAPIVDTAPDDEAGLWIVTWGLGAGRADLRTLGLEMKPQGLWSSDVRALVVERGRLLAGGLGDARATGGISEWNRATGTWRYTFAVEAPGLISDRVTGLATRDREVWAAVRGGIARRDGRGRWRTWTRSQGMPDDRTTALAIGAGAVWVGTFRGGVAVAGDSLSPVPLPGRGAVRDIAAGAGGVWWATEEGAYAYRGRWPDGFVVRLEHPEGRLDAQVDAVGTYGNEVWWVGAMGVVAYDAEMGYWLDVPPVGPFMPGEASDIALDGENVWIATAGGVWRLIRGTRQWHRYGVADGLIGRRVWTVALEPYAVWFGTTDGMTRFDYRLRRSAP